MAAGITQTGLFQGNTGKVPVKAEVQAELRSALKVLVRNELDLLIVEV